MRPIPERKYLIDPAGVDAAFSVLSSGSENGE